MTPCVNLSKKTASILAEAWTTTESDVTFTIEHHKKDMEIIRELGATTLRLAHYQHAQEFYDLCAGNGQPYLRDS